MLNYLLFEVVSKASLPQSVMNAIREVMGSFEQYRRRVPCADSDEVDWSWRAGWPKSADAAFTLLEDRACLSLYS